ncbi:MAG: M50 family metallopeptidase [Acidobacteriota bacterium]|nr:MAG: M50 family metallopeptidase [Acidobacteriota bacterium]
MGATRATKDRALWLLLGAVALTVALYVVPYGYYVGYPLVLLSTYAHEMGHGLTALAVGGGFDSFVMAPDGSGLAYLRVPDSRLTHAATSAGGLIGPALLAAAFFALARSSKTAHVGLSAFGAATLVSVVAVVRSPFGWLFVGVLGAGCAYLGLKSSARVAQAVLAFLAVQLSLSVFSRGDYLFTETAGAGPSDVAQMARALFLPYWFWGIVCGAISVLVLLFGVRIFLGSTHRV